MMYSPGSDVVNNGKLDLLKVDFNQKKLIKLNGKWEFYWDRLLAPEDFTSEHKPQMDTFMKVPGSWHDSFPEGQAPYKNWNSFCKVPPS